MADTQISILFGLVCGFLSYAFGVNEHLEVLIWAITLDIIVGVLASFVNEKLMFNSLKMCSGIIKKIVILTLVMFSHQLDILMSTDGIIVSSVTCFFIANEGMSVLENAGKCGIVLPRVLKNSLEQLKDITNKKS